MHVLFPSLKGILTSGYAFEEHELRIRAAGLEWLPKPYTVDALANAVRRVMSEVLASAPPEPHG